MSTPVPRDRLGRLPYRGRSDPVRVIARYCRDERSAARTEDTSPGRESAGTTHVRTTTATVGSRFPPRPGKVLRSQERRPARAREEAGVQPPMGRITTGAYPNEARAALAAHLASLGTDQCGNIAERVADDVRGGQHEGLPEDPPGQPTGLDRRQISVARLVRAPGAGRFVGGHVRLHGPLGSAAALGLAGRVSAGTEPRAGAADLGDVTADLPSGAPGLAAGAGRRNHKGDQERTHHAALQ